MADVQTLTVTEAEAGQKLLQYLARRTGAPQTAVHKWIRSGQVRVDKARAKPFQRLKQGQRVRIPPLRPGPDNGTAAEPGAALPALPIVHEDADILVVAKPAGLPAHGGTGHGNIGSGDSVAARLRAMFPVADFAPTLAHRLDKGTSGLLAAAKTYQALRRLQERFATERAGKTYLAWVAGAWPHAGVLGMTDRLDKTGEPGREKVGSTATGKTALARALLLKTLDRPDTASLLALRLVTGRTHQLRVQLAERGHPILGDRKYGGPPHEPMLLHAFRLTLPGRTLTLLPDWPTPWKVATTIPDI